MRKSSLVEWTGTENVARLKHPPEAWDDLPVLVQAMVGERSVRREAGPQGPVEGTEVRMPE